MAWLTPLLPLDPKPVTAPPHATPDPHILISACCQHQPRPCSQVRQGFYSKRAQDELCGECRTIQDNTGCLRNSGFHQSQAAFSVCGSLPWSCCHVCVRCSPSTSSRAPQLPFHPPCPPANTGLTPTEGVQPLGAHGSSPRGPRSDPSITPKRPDPNTHLLRKAVPDF